LDLKKGIGELSIPKPLDNWDPEDADQKAQGRGAPSWKSMYNPGEWSEFTYRGFKFKAGKNGPYQYHSIPTGARPVPDNLQGKRVITGDNGDWELHYKKGWTPYLADHDNWSGASSTKLFPGCCKGMLDYSLLQRMGLITETRIINCDALFFSSNCCQCAIWKMQVLKMTQQECRITAS
jgi:hypothetical protein